MRRIDRMNLRAPTRVLDLELTARDGAGEEIAVVKNYKCVWCLSRVHGVPKEISFWDVAEDVEIPMQTLRDRVCNDMAASQRLIQFDEPSSQGAISPDLTVVICTRDRPTGLRATLASLRHQTDTEFRVLVVDNGSSSAGAETIAQEAGFAHCEYGIEPRPGLSRARNKALELVSTETVSWIDDDEIADTDWVRRLKQGFAHEAKPAAVCGVMLPAELEFEAQIWFEQYGGFNKGRGLTAEVLQKNAPSVVSPLYPLPPFGPGGNMAFRTESLLSVGRFDPYLGAGTRTSGGEETRVMSMLLSAGEVILHWPVAITWHTHRREISALEKQLHGYGTGTSAFYASMIRSNPAVILDILRLAPYAVRDFRSGSGSQRTGHLPDDFPPQLLRAARRGLLEGCFIYAYETIKNGSNSNRLRKSSPVDQRHV